MFAERTESLRVTAEHDSEYGRSRSRNVADNRLIESDLRRRTVMSMIFVYYQQMTALVTRSRVVDREVIDHLQCNKILSVEMRLTT